MINSDFTSGKYRTTAIRLLVALMAIMMVTAPVVGTAAVSQTQTQLSSTVSSSPDSSAVSASVANENKYDKDTYPVTIDSAEDGDVEEYADANFDIGGSWGASTNVAKDGTYSLRAEADDFMYVTSWENDSVQSSQNERLPAYVSHGENWTITSYSETGWSQTNLRVKIALGNGCGDYHVIWGGDGLELRENGTTVSTSGASLPDQTWTRIDVRWINDTTLSATAYNDETDDYLAKVKYGSYSLKCTNVGEREVQYAHNSLNDNADRVAYLDDMRKKGLKSDGRVMKEDGTPCSNCTVQIIGSESRTALEELRENQIPNEFDPNIIHPGTDAFKSEAGGEILSGTSDTSYVVVNEKGSWEEGDISSGQLKLEETTIELSVWESTRNSLGNDAHDDQHLGDTRGDTPIVMEKVGPGSEDFGMKKIQTNRERKGEWDSGWKTWTKTREYARVDVPPGFYRVYPEGQQGTAYMIQVGTLEDIAPLIGKNITDANDKLTKTAQDLKSRVDNGSAEVVTVKTNNQGYYNHISLSKFDFIGVQAWKLPKGANTPPRPSPSDVQSAYTSTSAIGPAYMTPRMKVYKQPNNNAEVTVVQIDRPYTPGFNTSVADTQALLDQLNRDTLYNSDEIRERIQNEEELLETHRELRGQLLSSPGAQDTFCTITPSKCGVDGSLDLLDVAPEDRQNLTDSEMSRVESEVGLMQSALDSTGGTSEGNLNAGGGTIKVSDDPPETLSKVIETGVDLASLEGVTVKAVWESDSETISSEYLELEESGYGPNGTSSAIRVAEWPVPDKGTPDAFTVDFDTDQDGTYGDGDVDNGTQELQMLLSTDEYNLSNTTYDVIAVMDDVSQQVIPEENYTQVNESTINITGWKVPEEKALLSDSSVGFRFDTQESTNNTNVSTDERLLNVEMDVGEDISDSGAFEIKNVTATLDANETVVIEEQYWTAASPNNTALNITDWPIPGEKMVVTAVKPHVRVADGNVSKEVDTGVKTHTYQIPNYDLTAEYQPWSTEYIFKDGSRADAQDCASWGSDADDVTVSECQVPDGKTVDRIMSVVKVTGGYSNTSVSDSSGTLDVTVDTGYQIHKNTPVPDGELFVGSVYANFSDGSQAHIGRDYWQVDSSTELNITGWGFNSSKTVDELWVDPLWNPNPVLNNQSVSSGDNTLRATVETGRDLSSSSNWTVDSLQAVMDSGAVYDISSSYYEVNSSQNTKVDVVDWPVPEGESVNRVEARVLEDPERNNQSVTEGDGITRLNTTVQTGVNLTDSAYFVEAVLVEYDNATEAQIGNTYWEIKNDSEVIISNYPLEAGVTVVGTSVDVGLGNSTESRNESTSIDDGDQGTISESFTFDSEIPQDADVSVIATYDDGSTDQISSGYVSIGQYRFKVFVESWPVPEGKTVSSLEAQVTSTGEDGYDVGTGVDEGDTSQVLGLEIDVPEGTTESDVDAVNAVYQSGGTASIDSQYWSLDSSSGTITVAGWQVPSGKTVDKVVADVGNVSSVNGNVSESHWLNMEIPFDGGLGGSSLSEDDVSVMVHFADGSSVTMDDEYYGVVNRIGRDDLVVVEDWHIPQDMMVADVEVMVVKGDGVDSIRSPVQNPSFSAEVPAINSLRSTTLRPGPEESVRMHLDPDKSTFGNLTDVTVYGPNGEEVNVTRKGVNGRTFQFTSNGTGDHVVELTFTNPSGDRFVERTVMKAGEQQSSGPPTIRAARAVGGLYVVTGDGLTGGEIDRRDDEIGVTAEIRREQDVPDNVEVYLSEVDGHTRDPISVKVVRADGQEVNRKTEVRVHTDSLSNDALVYRNGDPLGEFGEVNRSMDHKSTIKVLTDENGEVAVSVSQDPNIWERGTYMAEEFAQGLPVIGGLVNILGTPQGTTSGGALAMLGLAGVLRRRRGDSL